MKCLKYYVSDVKKYGTVGYISGRNVYVLVVGYLIKIVSVLSTKQTYINGGKRMKRILICVKQKLSRRMINSARKIVRKCDYGTAINEIRLLGLSYNSIPIRPNNMNRVAVLMNEVKSIN